MRRFLPIAVMLLLLLGGSARAWDDEDEGFPEDYQVALTPYGQWIDGTPYGRVWHPGVGYGWRPYVDGNWVWTPQGWAWVSYEPWAWTFHYGRWGFVSGIGWCWVPGFVYAPAWVDWYWGDGFVGWAPLPPFGVHVAIFDHYTFVHDRDFCAPRLRTLVIHHDRLPRHVVHVWRGGSRRPPAVHDIERVARYPVVRVNHRPPAHVIDHGNRRRRIEVADDGRRVPHAPHPPRRVEAPHADRRVEPADRYDARPRITSAPVPRRHERTQVAPWSDRERRRADPDPHPQVLQRRAPEPIVPRERFAPRQDHGRRAEAYAPPQNRDHVTMHPSGAGGRQPQGGAPRHQGGGDRRQFVRGGPSGLR